MSVVSGPLICTLACGVFCWSLHVCYIWQNVQWGQEQGCHQHMFVFFHFGCNMLCWSGVSNLVHLGSQVLVTSKSQTLLVPQDFHWSSNRSEPAMKETDGDCSWHLFCCVVMVCSVSIFLDSCCPSLVETPRGMGHRDDDVFISAGRAEERLNILIKITGAEDQWKRRVLLAVLVVMDHWTSGNFELCTWKN